MGFVDPLSAMPAQQAVKLPVDLEKWADNAVAKAAKFIQEHLATPQPAANAPAANAPAANAQTQTSAQPAPTQPAAETQKVQAPPEAKPANMLDGVFTAWSRVHGRLDDLVKRDRGYRDAMREDPSIKDRRPEIREFYDNYNMNLLALQMEMGDVSFAMEVASKMIEHGTSAAKTAMQTQI